jgi:hypothetical protein
MQMNPYTLMIEDVSDRLPDGTKDKVIKSPTWAQVENALCRMNGNERSYVALKPSEDPGDDRIMVIGGGEADKYVCFYYDGDEYNLVDLSVKPGTAVAILMGQTSMRDQSELVDRRSVLIAAKAFLETGALASELTWRKQEI